MAISRNNDQSYSNTPDATPIDVSYTVNASLSNTVLCVAARLQTSSGALSNVSVTYGGQAMTTGYGVADVGGSYFIFAYKFAPVSGANTISIAYTTAEQNAAYLISAFTLAGVKQSGGLRDSNTVTGTSGTSATIPALSGVIASDYCVMALGVRTATLDQNLTWGTGQTEIHDLSRDNSTFYMDLGTSYEYGEANLTGAWTNSANGYAAWGGAFAALQLPGTATATGTMTATGSIARYPVFSMGVPRNSFSKNIEDF